MSDEEEPVGDLPSTDHARTGKVAATTSSGTTPDASAEIPKDVKYILGIGPQHQPQQSILLKE